MPHFKKTALSVVLGLIPIIFAVASVYAAETNPQPLTVNIFHALGEHGLFTPGQPIQMVLSLTNNESTATQVDIELKVKDFQDGKVGQQTMTLALEPLKSIRHELSLPSPERLGFFCVDATIGKRGNIKAQAGFCVLPPMEEARDAFFGMDKNGLGISFASIKGRVDLFNAFKMIGVGSLGVGFGGLSPYGAPSTPVDIGDENVTTAQILEKVKYDMEQNQYRAASVLKLSDDFHLVGYLCPDRYEDSKFNSYFKERVKKGLFPLPDFVFERFGDVVELIAELTKGRVKTWIIQEEIDARGAWGSGKGSFENGMATAEIMRYALLEKIAYSRLKKVSPDCEVAMPGLCCTDYTNTTNTPFTLLRLLQGDLKNHYDCLALDAYWGNWNGTKAPLEAPEAMINGHAGFRQMLLDAVKLQEQFGKQKKVLITEKGLGIAWHLPFDHLQSKILANYTARNLILAKSVPAVTFYAHYLGTDSCAIRWNAQKGQVEELKSDNENPVLDFGLWKHVWDFEEKGDVYSPRSAVVAYATVARLLAHVTQPLELQLRNDVYVYLFKKKELTIAALWTTKKPFEAEVSLPMAAELCDLMGNKSSLPTGKVPITYSESPVFLICKAAPKAVAEALGKTIFPSMPLVEGEAHLTDLATVTLHLVNKENRLVEAEWQLDPLKSMEWTVSTGKVTMKPLEQRTVSIGLKGADVKRLGEERVIGRIKAEGQEFKIDSSLSVIPVPRIKVGMKVDGALGKYAHIDPLVLKSPQDVYPREAIRTETGLLTGDDDIGVTFYMAYDDNNLYLAARVLDDKHLQRQNGVNIWMDDCLQFAFDTKNDALSPDLKGKSGYDGDDYNFGMALTAKGSEAWCWVNPNPAKVGQCAFPVSVRREGKETLYELAIPWEQLAPLKPREGQVFGFSFVVFDNDREADAQAAYWIALTPGVAGGADPSVYKKFMLIPPNSTE